MSPDEVAEFLSKLIKEDLKGGPVDVIGSSLGGFYAAWAKEHPSRVEKAVLLNPALGNWGQVDFQPGWHKVSGLDREMYVCPEFHGPAREDAGKGFEEASGLSFAHQLEGRSLRSAANFGFSKRYKDCEDS